MSILHIITRLDMGGSAESVLQLATAQKLRGHQVAVAYGMTSDHQDPGFFDRTGIAGYYIPELAREFSPYNDISALVNLFAVTLKVKPKVVHTHAAKAGFLGRIAARLAGCKAVVHSPHGHIFHGYYAQERTDFFVRHERFAARFCDRILTLTETEAEDYVRLKVAPRGKFTTVPMGIYLGRFKNPNKTRAEVRESLDIPQDAPVVGWIGRLDLIKDCATFMSSFPIMEKALPGVKYLIVGNGEERATILHWAERIGHDKVIMTGRRKDVPELLAAVDAVALTSLNEGLGRVLIEGMAAGVPVVATAVGGTPEVLGGAGVLIPAKDPQALADALMSVLTHEKFRAELVAKGRERAEKFSIEATVTALEGLYEEILKAKG
ncbi:MAG: glycosyltransferase [Nitrospirae bacterium]|nr:glycosyltransferase [Nitrospirota bacterium]MBI5695435.1 glycosyltransferase [Nitrospirota bacterium]